MILIDPYPESKMIKSVSERKRVKGEMLIINHLPVRTSKKVLCSRFCTPSRPNRLYLQNFCFKQLLKFYIFYTFFTLKHLFILGTGRYRYKILFYSFKSMVVQFQIYGSPVDPGSRSATQPKTIFHLLIFSFSFCLVNCCCFT